MLRFAEKPKTAIKSQVLIWTFCWNSSKTKWINIFRPSLADGFTCTQAVWTEQSTDATHNVWNALHPGYLEAFRRLTWLVVPPCGDLLYQPAFSNQQRNIID